MIRHCVFLNFRSAISDADKRMLMDEIIALKSHLPGILAVHVGGNVSPETGMDKGYSDGFMVDFDEPDSRDTYLADAQHQATGARLVAAAEEGVAGILVYDLEIPEQ